MVLRHLSANVAISDNTITDAMLRQSLGLSVIGRAANTAGNVADIVAAADHQVLVRNGAILQFGRVDLSSGNSVVNALGVPNGGTGNSSFTSQGVILGNGSSALGVTTTNATSTAKFLMQYGNGANVTFTGFQAVSVSHLASGNVNEVWYGDNSGDFTQSSNLLFDDSNIRFQVGDLSQSSNLVSLDVDNSNAQLFLNSPFGTISIGDPLFLVNGCSLNVYAGSDFITASSGSSGNMLQIYFGSRAIYTGDSDGGYNSTYSALDDVSQTYQVYGSSRSGLDLNFASRIYQLGEGYININASSGAFKLPNFTSNGFLKTGSGNGTLSVDTATYTPTTRTISTTTPLAGGGDLSANRTLTIADAVADGSTKGAATFTAADFNAASGVISIDYTNGQAATSSVKGFLTSADYNIFFGRLSLWAARDGTRWNSTSWNNATQGAVAHTLNTVQYYPVIIDKQITLTDVAINVVSNAVGAKARFGVYTSSAGRPTNLLVDFGEVLADSNGTKSFTGLSQVLVPGLYFFSSNTNNSTPTFSAIGSTMVAPIIAFDSTIVNAIRYSAFTEAQTYTTTLPTSAGTLALVSSASTEVYIKFT